MERVGPGLWYNLHKEALLRQDLGEFIQYLTHFIEEVLPCEECQKHARQYIRDLNPPTLHRHMQNSTAGGHRLDNFLWTVDFHNHVNSSLKKPLMSYEDAMYMYTGALKGCSTCSAKRH